MTQAIQFSFTTADCIAMRNEVVKFYQGLVPGRGMYNIVSGTNPMEDVCADIQMVCYIYLAMIANQELAAAAEEAMPHGKKAMHGEARKIYGYYRKDWADFYRRIPLQDLRFISNYAEIDEAIDDHLQILVKQTYYPVLNEILARNRELPSAVCRATAHAITALAYFVYGLERGMQDNHGVHSPLLNRLSERVCKLSAVIPHLGGGEVWMSDQVLESIMKQIRDAITNAFRPVMEAVAARCEQIDLQPYVLAADCTTEQFDARIKEIRAQNMRHITDTSRQVKLTVGNQKILK